MIRRFDLHGAVIVFLLVVMHFALAPWLGDRRVSPDFLLLALLVFALRARPGSAAIAGFVLGLVNDSLAPFAFGASVMAHTVVGYLAAWGKAVFFAENLIVTAGVFFAGTWFRDLLLLLVGGFAGPRDFIWQLALWSILKGITTALVGVLVVIVFRERLNVRLYE